MGMDSSGDNPANAQEAGPRGDGVAKLHVLAVGTLYPPHAIGGFEAIFRDAVEALRAQGHTVKVLCSDWTANTNGAPADRDAVRELRLYIDGAFDVRDESRDEILERERHNREVVERVLGELQPNVVLLGPAYGLPLSVITQITEAGVPQIAFVGDEWPKDAPKTDPGQGLMGLTSRLLRRSARELGGRRFHYGDVDRWVCASGRIADVVRRAGADPATVSVVHPGADTRRFTRRDPGPWRGRLLCAGPLRDGKGYEFAIRALADLPKCTLVIAGAGDPRVVEKLTKLAEERGVGSRVKLLGEQRERLPQLYGDADAVIFPSVASEGWGLVPLEAMTVGRPVIATAVGGPKEYLRDGENALVVRPSDSDAIVAAVNRLAEDEGLRKKLVKAGSATAGNYRYDRFLDELTGAVVALGNVPGVQGEDKSVSEPQEEQTAAKPADETAVHPANNGEQPGAAVPGPAQTAQSSTPQAPQPPKPAPAAAAAQAPGAVSQAPPSPASAPAPPKPPPAPPTPAGEGEQKPEPPKPQQTEHKPEQPKPQQAEAKPEERKPEGDKTPKLPGAPTPPPVSKPTAQGPNASSAPAKDTEAPEIDDEDLPEAEEWLPEGAEPREPDASDVPASSKTAEWRAVAPPPPPPSAPSAPPAPPTPAAQRAQAAAPAPQQVSAGADMDLVSRLAALEARVAELSTSAVAGIERNASEIATLEGRVSELATSAIGAVERNSAELAGIEKRVGELTQSAVSGVEREELTALEQRVTELAKSAVEGVERNAARLSAIETRLNELAASAATAREHQGSELGSLQTRVGELAAFAELRGEALGQRIDEIERLVRGSDSSWAKALEEVAARLERVEQLAAETWEREVVAAHVPRATGADAVADLEGMAKLNEASFEQLRAYGLSGTQAARLLAAREARGGFTSVDELESIPGFPPALLTELKQLVEG